MAKIQLGVIFGSRSCEREVAIISAVQLMNHVDTDKYQLVPVYISEEGVWYSGEALRQIDTYRPFRADRGDLVRVRLDLTSGSGALTTTQPGKGLFGKPKEVLYARLQCAVVVMHGLNGEDGTLQGLLELANIPYTSTGVAGSAIGMDKILMKQFFRGAGLPVLPGLSLSRTRWEKSREQVVREISGNLGFPVFVKPANLGSSIGVSRANAGIELEDALELAFEYDRRVLVEKGLEHPIELNCSVLGYDEEAEVSPIEMPISSHDLLDFGEKYLHSGGSKGMASLSRVVPAPIEDSLRDQLQQMSCSIFRMLDCKGVVRIDYMYDQASGNTYITEINTIPGSLAYYLWEAKGIRYAELIDRMVSYALKAHEEKNARNYAYSSNILQAVGLGAKGSKGSKGTKGKL